MTTRCLGCGLTKRQARGVKCVVGRVTYSQHYWPVKQVQR